MQILKRGAPIQLFDRVEFLKGRNELHPGRQLQLQRIDLAAQRAKFLREQILMGLPDGIFVPEQCLEKPYADYIRILSEVKIGRGK